VPLQLVTPFNTVGKLAHWAETNVTVTVTSNTLKRKKENNARTNRERKEKEEEEEKEEEGEEEYGAIIVAKNAKRSRKQPT